MPVESLARRGYRTLDAHGACAARSEASAVDRPGRAVVERQVVIQEDAPEVRALRTLDGFPCKLDSGHVCSIWLRPIAYEPRKIRQAETSERKFRDRHAPGKRPREERPSHFGGLAVTKERPVTESAGADGAQFPADPDKRLVFVHTPSTRMKTGQNPATVPMGHGVTDDEFEISRRVRIQHREGAVNDPF